MIELIDTHAHLQFESYGMEPSKVLDDAARAGVRQVICVGTTLDDSEQAVRLAAEHESVWASVGIHPHDAAAVDVPEALERLKRLATDSKVVAIGEIGLDYYRELSPRPKQKEVFGALLGLAAKLSVPVIFHARDAWDDFWPLVDSHPGIKGVIHSFSAYPEQLQQALKRDFYVGLNGIMTFTSDARQLEAAKAVPLSKLLLETDAPFLTPKPFRGTICESKHVEVTASFLARLRGEPLEELAAVSTQNARELFGLAKRNN